MKKIYLLFLFLILLNQTNNLIAQGKQGQAKVDSLLVLLKETGYSKTYESNDLADTSIVKLLNNIGYTYYSINPDEGIKYSNQALLLAEILKWKIGIADANQTLGVIFWSKAENQKAQNYYQKALKYYEELGNQSRIATCLGNIGNVFLYQSDYPKALDYFLRSLKITEELGDKKLTAIDLGNIGILYASKDEFTKALEYYFKALKICEVLGDKRGISKNLGSIGNVYNQQKNYSKALEYYLKSLKICEEQGDKRGIATNQANLGSIYNTLKNYPKALTSYLNALKLDKELANKSGMAISLSNIGLTYLYIATDSSNKVQLNKLFSGNRTEALLLAKNYVDSATTIMKEIGDLSNLFMMYHDLSEIHNWLGDYKTSLLYYKLYTNTKDSIFSQENGKKLAGLEAKREAELKEKEIELSKLEEERKENIQLAMIGVFIMFLIGGLLLISKKKISPRIINILSTFSVLIIFELVALLLHPHITNITHHNLILTLLALVGVASIIVPLHHKAEHWMKEKLVRKELLSISVNETPVDETPLNEKTEDETPEDVPSDDPPSDIIIKPTE